MPSRPLALVALLVLAAATAPGASAGSDPVYEGWAHQLHDCEDDWGADSAGNPSATGHDLVALDVREGPIPGTNGTGFGIRLTMEGGFTDEPTGKETLADVVNLTIRGDDGTQNATVVFATRDDRDFVARSHTFPDRVVGRTNASGDRFHVTVWYNHHRFGIDDGDAVVADGVTGYHIDEERNVEPRDRMPGGYVDPSTGSTVEGCPNPADAQRHRDGDGYQVRETPGPPPLADFTRDEEEVDAGEEVRFTDRSTDPNDTVVRRQWYFGDGNTTTGEAPTHAYEEPGEYDVSLVVTDAEGNRNFTATTVEVAPAGPIAATGVAPANPHAGEVVYFNSTSGEPDENLTYHWRFGDGTTGSGRNVTHVYGEAGTYEVTLNVTDVQGRSDEARGNLTVGPAPGEGTDAPDGSGNGPDGTTDDTDSQGDGDGGDGTADDRDRASNETGDNRPPVARIQAPSHVPVGEPVGFTSRSTDPDGAIDARQWTFGDGASHGRPNPNHTYASPGRYNVTLTVVDDDDARDTTQHRIVVGSPGDGPVGNESGASEEGPANETEAPSSPTGNGSAAQAAGGEAKGAPAASATAAVLAGLAASLARRRR